MQRVFVLNTNKKAIMPCQPARARILLKKKKASIYKRHLFTIVLKQSTQQAIQKITLKNDPGSATSGITLVGNFKRGNRVVWAANLTHRATTITKLLRKRKAIRKGRRFRKTRYRKARFNNRTSSKSNYTPLLNP